MPYKQTHEDGRVEYFSNPPIGESTYVDDWPVETIKEISRRQLILGMWKLGVISDSEAVAAAKTGAVPSTVAAIFSQLPANAAIEAEITWGSMTTVNYSDPLVLAVLQSTGRNEADAVALWEEWALL